jgi:hypothetical protein
MMMETGAGPLDWAGNAACGAGGVRGLGEPRNIRRLDGRQAGRDAADHDVVSVEDAQRRHVQIAGRADAGVTDIDGAVRRDQIDVGGGLPHDRLQCADAGARHQAGGIDLRVTVEIGRPLQRRIEGRGLGALAGVEVAVRRTTSGCDEQGDGLRKIRGWCADRECSDCLVQRRIAVLSSRRRQEFGADDHAGGIDPQTHQRSIRTRHCSRCRHSATRKAFWIAPEY